MSEHNMKEPQAVQQPQESPGLSASQASLGSFGRLLESNRTPARVATWKVIMFCLLGLLVVLNVFIANPYPHFGVDKYPGFWAVFSCLAGVAMIFLVKKIVQPLIKRSEDYYGDI